MATVFERVKAIIVDQLGVEEGEVKPSASFVEDLHADSLDLVELIMALEEAFTNPTNKVEIPDEDVKGMVTVQDVVDYIKRLGIEDK